MKSTAKIGLAAAAALMVTALAGMPQVYARADGAAGAGRVEQVASYVSPQDLREFDAGHGRTGA